MDSPRVCEDTNQFLAAFRASQDSLKKYYSSPKSSHIAKDHVVNGSPSPAEEKVSTGLKGVPNQRGSSTLTISSALATSATATTPYVAENQSSENKMSPDRRQYSPPLEEGELSGDEGKDSTSGEKDREDKDGKSGEGIEQSFLLLAMTGSLNFPQLPQEMISRIPVPPRRLKSIMDLISIRHLHLLVLLPVWTLRRMALSR